MLAVMLLGVAVLAGTAAYWRRDPAQMQVRAYAFFFAAAGISFAVWLAWTERPQLTVDRHGEPVAVAIALDLSPSMLAQPVSSSGSTMLPRYERATVVVKEVIDGLAASNDHFLVAMTGFAGEAAILIGWHDNLAEVREILDYAVTPELFADNGTSLESAAGSIQDLFNMLPPRFDGAQRVVLFVSDGEDTVRSSDVGYATLQLARSEAQIIAIQVGLTEQNEGIPVYNDFGEFQGFRVFGGRQYTRPSPEAMRAIAGVRQGLYVRAEDPSASSQILEQLRSAGPTTMIDRDLIPILGLFVITFLSLLMVLK